MILALAIILTIAAVLLLFSSTKSLRDLLVTVGFFVLALAAAVADRMLP